MFKKLFNSLTGSTQNEEQQQENHHQEEETNDDNGYQETEFDPETLHGTHYSIEDFNAEVERRVKYETERRDETSQSEVKNWRFNLRRDVYKEWTGADDDQMIRWEHANSMEFHGVQTSGFVKVDESNPMLAPIHGFSLKDYTAVVLKISAGVKEEELCKALGIDTVIWEEVNTLWTQRMAEDTSFTVTTLFGQYFGEKVTHPKLEGVQETVSEAGKANLEKMKSDRYFYEELCGARQAAYEYGMDGAQWILENYGINLGDFQSVAMEHMTAQNQNWDSNEILHFVNYQQEKQKEYAAKFAAEQGGNVADDVEF